VIAVTLPAEARRHLLLLVVAVTVTPGTAVVDTDPDSGTLYLHLLNSAEREATELHVRRIADLACRALPTRANREVAT
jgi:multisubunit Na+/H+ antiporter MnhE subunit